MKQARFPFGAWLSGLSLAVAAAATVQAAPVNFTLTPVSFSAGAGYGSGATQLDVDFAATTGVINFALAAPADSFTFAFGTVTMLETGNIALAETDNLGVLATFAFADPFFGLRNVIASGTATTGPLADVGIDLTIDWNPVNVAFGNGGVFTIDMDTLNFRLSGQVLTQDATITLVAAPLPEPATLALVGAALGGVAFTHRRRRQAGAVPG